MADGRNGTTSHAGSRWKLGLPETLTIAGFAIGIAVWGVRLEGQVAVNSREIENLKAQRVEDLRQTREDLAYIRSRIDAALRRDPADLAHP